MEFFELQVWLPGRGALCQLVEAVSMDHALAIARSKYPGATVDVPAQKAVKPRLARSRTSPSVAAKARTKMAKAKQTAQWAQEAWARVEADQARADFLEKLYEEDGRDDVQHPLKKTYTGLYQQYLERMDTGV
jgi:hypothetical protein